MGLQEGFNLFWNSFMNTRIFGSGGEFIIPLAVVLVIGLIISPKKISNLKVTALPIMVGLKGLGIGIPLLYLVLGGIVFVMESMSLQQIGGFIATGFSKAEESFGEESRLKRKLEKKRFEEKLSKVGIKRSEGITIKSPSDLIKNWKKEEDLNKLKELNKRRVPISKGQRKAINRIMKKLKKDGLGERVGEDWGKEWEAREW